MYVWLWRRLPGPLPVKLLQSLALFALSTGALFLWVFPWVEAQLPYNDVTVPVPPATPAVVTTPSP